MLNKGVKHPEWPSRVKSKFFGLIEILSYGNSAKYKFGFIKNLFNEKFVKQKFVAIKIPNKKFYKMIIILNNYLLK